MRLRYAVASLSDSSGAPALVASEMAISSCCAWPDPPRSAFTLAMVRSRCTLFSLSTNLSINSRLRALPASSTLSGTPASQPAVMAASSAITEQSCCKSDFNLEVANSVAVKTVCVAGLDCVAGVASPFEEPAHDVCLTADFLGEFTEASNSLSVLLAPSASCLTSFIVLSKAALKFVPSALDDSSFGESCIAALAPGVDIDGDSPEEFVCMSRGD